MPLFVIYLEKLSISLAVVWLFYQLVLRRLTFYGWNRWYLLGYAAMAFFIPAVNVGRIVENGRLASATIIRYIPLIGDPKNLQTPAPITIPAPGHLLSGLASWDLLLAVLALGSTLLLIRFSARCMSLTRLRRRATLIGDARSPVKIYQVEGRIIPFSFGDAIYINRRQHTDKEWEEIILHEYVHIRQRHTVDILLAELLCILNWYNPFAWLIRYSIRQNLEFIADNKVLENGHDRRGYQYHLLKVIGESRYRLASNFNFSSLKKRIIMMNKIKSTRLHLVKFLFVLPLLVVLLVAFRSHYEGTRTNVAPSRRKIAKALPLTNGEPLTSLAPSAAPVRDSIPPDADAGKPGPIRPAQMGLQPVMSQHWDSLHPRLYFVDGVESVGGRGSLDKMNPLDIDHIDVWGSDSVRKVYGEKGKNGVIYIHMKHAIKDSIPADHAAARKDNLTTVVTVDKVGVNLKLMSKDTISLSAESLVINPTDTLTPANGNDHLYIIGTPNTDSLWVARRNAPDDKNARARPASLTVVGNYKGLILLNGIAVTAKELNSLDVSKITRYDIHMGNDEAIKQYGEKARDGAILVTTK